MAAELVSESLGGLDDILKLLKDNSNKTVGRSLEARLRGSNADKLSAISELECAYQMTEEQGWELVDYGISGNRQSERPDFLFKWKEREEICVEVKSIQKEQISACRFIGIIEKGREQLKHNRCQDITCFLYTMDNAPTSQHSLLSEAWVSTKGSGSSLNIAGLMYRRPRDHSFQIWPNSYRPASSIDKYFTESTYIVPTTATQSHNKLIGENNGRH